MNGEVRLWVNGEEVLAVTGISAGDGIPLSRIRGAPIEFKNLRLRKLKSPPIPKINLEKLTPKPVERIDLKGHPALGKWFYGAHSRQVTADGLCILREGDNEVWRRRAISKSASGFVLEGNLRHQLDGDVLKIEGRYEAQRKKP